MIVICAGMPKAGSAWYYNLVDSLIRVTGARGAHEVRERYDAHALLKGRNCAVRNLNAESLDALLTLGAHGESFAVKTHEPPSSALQPLMQRGALKGTYIYRDPRDAMLSALEYGAKMRARGVEDEVFTPTRTLVHALQGYVYNLATAWEQWRITPGTFVLRYEDLLEDPVLHVAATARFLRMDVTPAQCADVVREVAEVVGAGKNAQGVLHLNKGRSGRFKEVMTRQEQQLCVDVLGQWLELMGYDTALDVRADAPGVALHLTTLAVEEGGASSAPLAAVG